MNKYELIEALDAIDGNPEVMFGVPSKTNKDLYIFTPIHIVEKVKGEVDDEIIGLAEEPQDDFLNN